MRQFVFHAFRKIAFIALMILSSCWYLKDDIAKASEYSGVEIPRNSLCLYSENYDNIQESGDKFIFKIKTENHIEFCKKLEDAGYEKLRDTIVLIYFCPLSHVDTVKNGYMRYEECLENYYYDSDKRIFYVKDIND